MTPQPPSLLGPDGSASIATALMMSHHGMRRDLALFARALRALRGGGDPSRAAALRDEWARFHGTLHGHHHSEDTGVFPSVRGERPALGEILDRLEADHRRIDPLLEEADGAFAGLPGSASATLDVVERLSALLDAHLAVEEEHVIGHLRGIREFPPFADEVTALYAEGFAWSAEGIAPDVLERVFAMLPASVASKLPAARAAFARRCEEVWGSTPRGAARTPIPDWLGAGRAVTE